MDQTISKNKILRKLTKKAKAVSPIIATLLMIVIAVVAGVMIYTWMSTFMETGLPSAPTIYVINITTAADYNSSDTQEAYGDGGFHYWTDISLTVVNTGSKVVPVSADDIKLKDKTGSEYTDLSTGLRIWNVNATKAGINDTITTAYASGSHTPTAQAGEISLLAGATTTFYVRIINATATTSGEYLGSALTTGDSYNIDIEATTAEGETVICPVYAFKAIK